MAKISALDQPKEMFGAKTWSPVLESVGKFQFSKTDRRGFALKKPLTHFNLRSAHRFNWVEVELKQEDLLQITRILWTSSQSTELVGMVAINYLAVQTCFALIPWSGFPTDMYQQADWGTRPQFPAPLLFHTLNTQHSSKVMVMMTMVMKKMMVFTSIWSPETMTASRCHESSASRSGKVSTTTCLWSWWSWWWWWWWWWWW